MSRMTLDEAIKHAEEIAEEKRYEYQECLAVHDTEEATNCEKCGEEHRQLAEWLRDYKRLKEQEPMQVDLEGDGYADGFLVYDYGKCPKCGWQYEEGDKDWKEPFCCHCGQRLKWFEE